jgi:hypothetical protein
VKAYNAANNIRQLSIFHLSQTHKAFQTYQMVQIAVVYQIKRGLKRALPVRQRETVAPFRKGRATWVRFASLFFKL